MATVTPDKRGGGGRHPDPLAEPVRFVDQRLGTTQVLRMAMHYVFPDHWSFLLGEIALYSFMILIATGTFLALFFEPSQSLSTYHGAYAPLRGVEATSAYNSVIAISFDVPAGMLIRQTHHWAANLFIASIVVHLMRIFFTGAFRKPRELNYLIGVTLLALGLLEAFLGYMLPDDLMSGMGLVIAYAVGLAIPIVGGQVMTLIWDGRFPGSDFFWPRLFIGHVFIFPLILLTLIGLHLAIIMRQHHAQFRGPGRRETNVVGTPMWAGYALRSLGWLFMVAAVLFLLGGLVQINPVYLWGPYHTYLSTNGAQPDWYLGWLIGALRIMPPLEPRGFGHTWIPNPFWGGALFPGICFLLLYLWPWIEQRFITKDFRSHHLLDRPRDNPVRTGIGVWMLSWVVMVFVAGSADRLLVSIGFSYEGQVWFYRFGTLIVPIFLGWLAYRWCRRLRDTGVHPLREWSGQFVRRTATGGFSPVEAEVRAPREYGGRAELRGDGDGDSGGVPPGSRSPEPVERPSGD